MHVRESYSRALEQATLVQTTESDTVYVVNFLPNAVLTEETELLSFLPLFPYFRLEGIVPLTNGGRRTLPRFAK